MDTISKKPEKKEDGDKAKSMSTKAPLTERIMKKVAGIAVVATLAVAPSACLDWRIWDDDADAEIDAGHDADVDMADADISDGDVLDADVADSDMTDSDVLDGDVDEDGGAADADVSDADIIDGDADEEAGPTTCPGVSNGSIVSENVDVGDSAVVGGYSITYVGQVTGSDDIYVDINCSATGSGIETGLVVPIYGTITTVVPLDGKDIEITNHSSSDTRARISATVSDS